MLHDMVVTVVPEYPVCNMEARLLPADARRLLSAFNDWVPPASEADPPTIMSAARSDQIEKKTIATYTKWSTSSG